MCPKDAPCHRCLPVLAQCFSIRRGSRLLSAAGANRFNNRGLWRNDDHPDDPAQRAIFAGSRLALAILKDGAARNQPASIRVLARCAARALDAWDEEAATAFGETFSGEAEEVWKEELSRRLNTSGPIFPHHNWLLCLQLVGMNKPWAHALMTRWFPWKGKDSHEFIVQAAPASNRLPEAFWQEMTRDIYSHSLA